MRRLRHAVIPLVLLVVLGIGLVTSHEAVAQEDESANRVFEMFRGFGLSASQAEMMVWLQGDIEVLRTGELQDPANPNVFRGPSLADLEQILVRLAMQIELSCGRSFPQ